MEVDKFDPKSTSHRRLIYCWLESRGLNPNLSESLPATGYIAWKDKLPIAAGFIRKIEGTTTEAFLDSLITDPKASPEHRNEAVDAVVSQLIETAKQLEIKQFLAFTVDKNTLMRSQKFGFEVLPHALISLKVG